MITIVLLQALPATEISLDGEILNTRKQLNQSNLAPFLSVGMDLFKKSFEFIIKKNLFYSNSNFGPNLATAYFYNQEGHDLSNAFFKDNVVGN
ncbi:MAG: hypothetical protein U9N04_02365, partial [Patescibacteria group bacterium]|nr:hypothetical protein [Patescibacteria group bacterium]